jgi:hypothetical protein
MGDDGGKKDDFGDAFDAKAFEALERDFQEVRASKTLWGGVCVGQPEPPRWVKAMGGMGASSTVALNPSGVRFHHQRAWPPHFWHF